MTTDTTQPTQPETGPPMQGTIPVDIPGMQAFTVFESVYEHRTGRSDYTRVVTHLACGRVRATVEVIRIEEYRIPVYDYPKVVRMDIPDDVGIDGQAGAAAAVLIVVQRLMDLYRLTNPR